MTANAADNVFRAIRMVENTKKTLDNKLSDDEARKLIDMDISESGDVAGLLEAVAFIAATVTEWVAEDRDIDFASILLLIRATTMIARDEDQD